MKPHDCLLKLIIESYFESKTERGRMEYTVIRIILK